MSRSKVSHVIVSLGVIFALSIGWLPLAGSMSARATPPAQGEIIGKPQTGAPGVAESTAKIMQRESTAAQAPVHARPRFRVDRSQLPDNPLAPAVAHWPVGTVSQRPAAPLARQPIGLSFTGATLADTGAFPPDTMGAVGPTQFIVAVNGRLRSFNKTTGVADGVLNTTMDNFFNSVMTPRSLVTSPAIRAFATIA